MSKKLNVGTINNYHLIDLEGRTRRALEGRVYLLPTDPNYLTGALTDIVKNIVEKSDAVVLFYTIGEYADLFDQNEFFCEISEEQQNRIVCAQDKVFTNDKLITPPGLNRAIRDVIAANPGRQIVTVVDHECFTAEYFAMQNPPIDKEKASWPIARAIGKLTKIAWWNQTMPIIAAVDEDITDLVLSRFVRP